MDWSFNATDDGFEFRLKANWRHAWKILRNLMFLILFVSSSLAGLKLIGIDIISWLALITQNL
jgi:hypothetical protein